MREKKLTYNEIATFASKGLYDAIPNGYVIEWLPNPPGKFINLEIASDNIQMSGNKPPIPDLVKFKADYVFDLYRSLGGEDANEKEDYGTIILHTVPQVSNFELIYNSSDRRDRAEIMEWTRKYSETVTGRVFNKKDLVFDMKMKVGDGSTLDVYNALLNSVDFDENDDGTVEAIRMKIICDHWHFDF